MSRSRSSSFARAASGYALVGLGFVVLLAAGISRAGSATIPAAGEVRELEEVMSLKEARFRGTERQRYDFSCGAAAVATLLEAHYERPTKEAEVFEDMFETGDRAKIAKIGFSLLDMKRFLVSRGYNAEGYRISLEEITEARIPVIALLNVRGYKHFVVVKGVSSDRVLIGDPAFGTRVMSRADFESARGPFMLLVRNHREVAARHFETSRQFALVPEAPLEFERGRPQASSADPFLASPTGLEF